VSVDSPDQPLDSSKKLAGAAARVARRRTFAIISHPDAGKTTLTENLLLFGGAIHMAGEVKARGAARRARSDWMKIEQKRGISVTSAVMTFAWEGITFNLLDTPGHEDFSEDTYRTLTAADSAIMVLDAAKGIEAQTLKLFEVCRLRDIPIITFINKVDAEGQSPFDLLDQVADKLALDTCPMTWPVGMGKQLAGIAHLDRAGAPGGESGPGGFVPFARPGAEAPPEGPFQLQDPQLESFVPDRILETAREEAELAAEGYPQWDREAYLAGTMTPVYFGSALRNFGVRDVLQALSAFAPPPRPTTARHRVVSPEEKNVTGFVFKVQANMDAKHRDRVAFMRLCSGRFERGMKLQVSSSGKTLSITNPILFFAQERETVDEAWPGDIIGIPNHGTIRVGDALYEGEQTLFPGIPDFAPEILQRIRIDDPMKAKHLRRALENLADEGVSQIFKPLMGASFIVGVVGQLQLEVLASRLSSEYKVDIGFDSVPYETARWVHAETDTELKSFVDKHIDKMVEDREGNPVFMAASEWELGYLGERWPAIRFEKTCER